MDWAWARAGDSLSFPSFMCNQQEEEAKYAKVIKVGNKLYGVPAVQEGTFGLDLQQQVGRRWEELVYELNGDVSAAAASGHGGWCGTSWQDGDPFPSFHPQPNNNQQVLFNRDPVYALPDQGTKSNPVLVRLPTSPSILPFKRRAQLTLFLLLLTQTGSLGRERAHRGLRGPHRPPGVLVQAPQGRPGLRA